MSITAPYALLPWPRFQLLFNWQVPQMFCRTSEKTMHVSDIPSFEGPCYLCGGSFVPFPCQDQSSSLDGNPVVSARQSFMCIVIVSERLIPHLLDPSMLQQISPVIPPVAIIIMQLIEDCLILKQLRFLQFILASHGFMGVLPVGE